MVPGKFSLSEMVCPYVFQVDVFVVEQKNIALQRMGGWKSEGTLVFLLLVRENFQEKTMSVFLSLPARRTNGCFFCKFSRKKNKFIGKKLFEQKNPVVKLCHDEMFSFFVESRGGFFSFCETSSNFAVFELKKQSDFF